MLSAWEGNEDYEAMQPAAMKIFEFIADIKANGLPIEFNDRKKIRLNVTPIFTGDFQVLSTVLGHQSGRSAHFCIKYNAKRTDHETRLTKGATRNFESMYKEGKIIENIKRAPLLKGLTSDSLSSPSVHILTGLDNTLLRCASKKNKEM